MDKRTTDIQIILHCIINKGTLCNWVDILYASLQAQVRNAQNYLPSFAKGFDMWAYLVDAICAITPFPLMNWNFGSFPGPMHT